MNELEVRALVLAGVVIVVALIARLRARPRKATTRLIHRSDLNPGLYLFSSATCADCIGARKVAKSVAGDAVVEIAFEADPARFGSFGVETVPTVVVVGRVGEAVEFQGVPHRRELQAAWSRADQ
ncbi:MAG TPA: hypothetical protein VIA81_13100 [Acidimicrobiia bacterium]|jgi:hypothetical protein